MSQDNWIGKPEDHDQYSYKINEPEGGYVDQRLSKLEFYQQALRNEFNGDNVDLGTSSYSQGCKACKASIIIPGNGLVFPLCQECTDNLGKITIARRNGKFLF